MSLHFMPFKKWKLKKMKKIFKTEYNCLMATIWKVKKNACLNYKLENVLVD